VAEILELNYSGRCCMDFIRAMADSPRTGLIRVTEDGRVQISDFVTYIVHELPDEPPDYSRLIALTSNGGELPEEIRNQLPKAAPEIEPEDISKRKEEAGAFLNPPGLVGDLARYYDGTARKKVPILGVAAGLAAVSALSRGHAVVAMPDGPTPINLYILGVAPTGVGKEAARTVCEHALMAAGQQETLTDAASGEALHRKLSGRRDVLWMPDEFGRYLEVASSAKAGAHQFGMLTMIMRLFGLNLSVLAGKAYASNRNTIPAVVAPFVTLLGTTTADTLVDGLGNKDVLSGFLNRMLMVVVEENHPPRRSGPAAELDQALKTRCHRISLGSWNVLSEAGERRAPEAKRVKVGENRRWAILPSEEAVDVLDVFYDEADKMQTAGDETSPLWVRAYEQAIRVAGVLAVGCWDPKEALNPQLSAPHARWAVDFVRWSTSVTCALVRGKVADNETEKVSKGIVAFVRECVAHPQKNFEAWNRDGWVPQSQITRRFQRVDKWKRDQIMQSLVEGGYLEQARIQQEGGNSLSKSHVYRSLLVD